MKQSWIGQEVRIYYPPHLEDIGEFDVPRVDSYESTDIGIVETCNAFGLTLHRPGTDDTIFVPWIAIKNVLLLERNDA